MARQIRDQNMAIRLLEIPLHRAGSMTEAAKLLNEFFGKTIGNDPTQP
jgi:hypothetical protein